MSLPQNTVSTTCTPGAFISPDDRIRATPTIDYERGGAALNDPSQGLEVKVWVGEVINDDVVLYPEGSPGSATVVLTEAGITEMTFAFDQNMEVVLGYVSDAPKIRFLNSGTSSFQTITLAPGSRSLRAAMDDKSRNATLTNSNDVLIVYLRGDKVYYRQQRELYAVERELYQFDGSSSTFIRRCGMTLARRFRIELFGLPPLPECLIE